MPSLLTALTDGARALCLVLTLRLLPFTVHAALSRRVAARSKAATFAVQAASIAVLARLGALSMVGWITVGMAYYLLVGCGMNRLGRLLSDRAITRGALFVLLAGLCLLLPGVAAPGVSGPAFLVVGWELLLRGYSYCVETSRAASRPSPADCLFFLFVNPTLVWSRRGAPLPGGADERGWGRAALGALVMLLNDSLLRPAARSVGAGSLGSWLPGRAAVLGLVVYGVLRFLSEYAAHSGLASIQIGLARRAGWCVPERYELPLLSRSPMEFWRRWNTYVRVWLEAYVFLPLATATARRSRSRVAQVVVAMAVLVASGLLHDGYVFASKLVASTHVTRLFIAAGAAAVGFRVAGVAGAAMRSRLSGSVLGWFDAGASVAAHLVMASGLTLAALVWL